MHLVVIVCTQLDRTNLNLMSLNVQYICIISEQANQLESAHILLQVAPFRSALVGF